jgi:hypothetical protein
MRFPTFLKTIWEKRFNGKIFPMRITFLVSHPLSQDKYRIDYHGSIALCAKGPFGTCPRPPFGQKIVPIFLFFCLGRVI